ncbi:hypothetical protein [Mycoplasmopsis glycophila]|uniref:DUF3899 domain-containing protein n=1 Tax=Mycoplasmopsis glycophila TaxID=171285 RepID=A0A449AVH2_9BACT|nr:hypothetical protein [Mycoplasmopsis glycophila]VEU70517.1 Uncharacterised protein [Mycoplasmopsis glycophila]
MNRKIILYLKNRFKEKRTYLIFIGFFILWISLFGIFVLGQTRREIKLNFLDLFSVATFITCLSSLFVLVFKWGFLRGTIERIRSNLETNHQIRNERRMQKMSHQEKEVFHRLEKERLAKKESKKNRSNFGFYLVFVTYLLASIPLILLSMHSFGFF